MNPNHRGTKRTAWMFRPIFHMPFYFLFLFPLHTSSAIPGAGVIHQTLKQLKKTPKNARLLTLLGHLYQRTGQIQLAAVHFQKALRFKPNYEFALTGLAQLSLRKRKWAQSQKLLRRILSRHPRQSMAHSTMSDWYRLKAMKTQSGSLQNKLLQLAVHHLTLAVRYQPRVLRYRFKLALLFLAFKQYQKAHFQFLTLVKQSPGVCHRHGLSIVEYLLFPFSKKTTQQLLTTYQQCTNPALKKISTPLYMSHIIRLAQKDVASGQFRRAIARLKKVLTRQKTLTEGHFLLAFLLAKTTHCKQTMVYLRKLQKRFPTSRKIRGILLQKEFKRCNLSKKRKLR